MTGMLLPSYAHTNEMLARTLTAFGHALEVVRHADATDDFDRYIELTLL